MSCICLKESEIQLGSWDCGDDSRFFLLGIHRDSDSRRLYIVQTGCKQVTAEDSLQEQKHKVNDAFLCSTHVSTLNLNVDVLLSRMDLSLLGLREVVRPYSR